MSAPTSHQQLRIGIVGCGGIARSNLRAYLDNPRVKLVGVFDIDGVRAASGTEVAPLLNPQANVALEFSDDRS